MIKIVRIEPHYTPQTHIVNQVRTVLATEKTLVGDHDNSYKDLLASV